MVKKILMFFLFSSLPFAGYSQYILEGDIFDQSTGESLPGANIGIENTYRGTVSNSEGSFSIKVDTLPVTLKITFLGFESQNLMINREKASQSLTIALKPTVISLSELTVTGDFEINLVEKAIDKLMSQQDNGIVGKGFYRQLTQSDSIYTEFIETFYSAQIVQIGIKNWKVQNGRFAVVSRDSLKYRIQFSNFSQFSLIGILDKKPYREEYIWPIREDARKYYNFYLNKNYMQDDNTVYLIQFEPKKAIDQPAFIGEIAIIDNSYVIQELDMKISDPNFNPVVSYRKKAKTENAVLQFVYKNSFLDGNGSYYPKSLDINLTFDYIKKKGLFGKIDFKRKVHTHSVLYFFDYETDGLSQFFTDDYFDGGRDKDVSDYQKINQTVYNPAFWENNPIVKRTPVEQKVIKSFEKYGSFGKMFNKQENEDSNNQ